MYMKKQLLITSGRGPQECNLAVSHIFQKMKDDSRGMKLNVEMISSEKDNGTICSIILSIEGSRAQEFATSWVGTIQWVCQSLIRSNHRRKNWFIAVQATENQRQIGFDERKIQFQSMRSSGAGGQHVNKVSSAIRAKYLPLNISLQVMDTRSQLQNKQIAIQRIKEKITSLNEMEKSQKLHHNWINQSQIARGNPIRVFEGIKFTEKLKSRFTNELASIY
jgi:peptide chain release factor